MHLFIIIIAVFVPNNLNAYIFKGLKPLSELLGKSMYKLKAYSKEIMSAILRS